MNNNKKIVLINEVRYKKYENIDQGSTAPVYKPMEVDYKKNIRKNMIKGYLKMLTKYYNQGSK